MMSQGVTYSMIMDTEIDNSCFSKKILSFTFNEFLKGISTIQSVCKGVVFCLPLTSWHLI
jgi:hypothetical protein